MQTQTFKRSSVALGFLFTVSLTFAQESSGYGVSVFAPKTGPTGTVVTLDGSGLGLKTTSVTINGLPASFVATQVYEIKVTIPAGATTGPIVCKSAGATAVTAEAFVVGTPPTNTPTSTIVPPPPHIARPSQVFTGHPRMWVRGTDIPRLRGWAVPSNPIWLDLKQVANYRKSQMIQGIVPQQDSGDGEGNSYPYATEEVAELFAFMSLVDPSATNRADWAQRAHDLLMYALNQAALGTASGQKFRTPHFATFNRSRWYGEAWPLVVDWCYDKFTPAEKATVRKVFIKWIHDILDPNVAGGSYTLAQGPTVNAPSLVGNKGAVRWSGNNYWCNHARNIAMMSMALDDPDDVPATAGDYPANYLGDYIGNAIGAWMYIRNYAESHDLAGAISPEGTAYAESSFSGLSMLLLSLHTTGYDQTTAYGPGAQLGQNAFWQSDLTTAYLHSLSPKPVTLSSWQPVVYQPAGFGDVQNFETVDMIRQFGPLAAMDLADGNVTSKRVNDIRWIQTWLSPGGPTRLDSRLTSSPWNYGTVLPILYFLTFDPTAPAPSDPRVGMSTSYFAPGLNRILERTDWSPNASWFAFISGFNSIDHQWGDSNSFSFYRRGEFITKEWSGYGKNIGSPDFQNNLSVENPPATSPLPGFIAEEASHGGQFSYMSNGDPVVRRSAGAGYVFAEGDATARYNSTALKATDVQHASRSIVWLKPDSVVVYDRADSKSANRYKRTYLNFATAPSLVGSAATVVTPNGQQVRVDALLPATATLRVDKPSTTWSYNEGTPEEPMHYRLISEDLTRPQSVRFLNVIQAADTPLIPATIIVPNGTTAYDGAVSGSTVVLFKRSLAEAFVDLTYTVPASVTMHILTGLVPGAGYSVTVTGNGGVKTVQVTAGGPLTADSGGVLILK